MNNLKIYILILIAGLSFSQSTNAQIKSFQLVQGGNIEMVFDTWKSLQSEYFYPIHTIFKLKFQSATQKFNLYIYADPYFTGQDGSLPCSFVCIKGGITTTSGALVSGTISIANNTSMPSSPTNPVMRNMGLADSSSDSDPEYVVEIQFMYSQGRTGILLSDFDAGHYFNNIRIGVEVFE